jgi:type I restriction enzyme S subunit
MTMPWKKSTLREITLQCDYGLSCGLSTDPVGLPILRMGNLIGGRVSLDDLKYVPKDKVSNQDLLEPGDILLNRTNSSDLVGKVGLFSSTGRITFASYLFRLRTDPSKAYPGWLAQLLGSPVYQTRLRDLATPGVSQTNINREVLRDLDVPLPPLPEQRKIAAILSSVDEAIEGAQAVIDQIQVVKKAMMADLLTRGVPGRHKTFKQTKLGQIPTGWEITAVGSLGEFSGGNGFRPPDWSTEGLPIIRIQNLNGSQDFNYFAGTPEPEWIVEPGELLFAWAGSRGASFGPCIWPGPRGVLNQHIHHIKPLAMVRKRFLFFLLQIITQEIEKKAHGFKDTLVHLRKAELTNWPMALPSVAEQDVIVASLDAVGDRLEVEAARLSCLRETKSALMSVLLTGEVRVRAAEESAA